jgi:hypothetical protein
MESAGKNTRPQIARVLGLHSNWRKASLVGAALFAAACSSASWAQGIVDQIPKPSGTLVPKDGVIWFGVFNLALMATAFAIMFWVAWRNRSFLPLFFLAGGALGGLVEPVFDGNIHVQFAAMDQPANWYFYNVGYPWFVIPGNAMLGAPVYFMYCKFRDGISARGLWLAFIGWWMFNNSWEIPGTSIGSYAYYGPHPFKFMGYPLWVGMMAGLGIPLAGYMASTLRGVMGGGRLGLMVAILMPVVIYGSEVITWPMWLALNGGASVETAQWMALLSLGFTLCAYHSLVAVYTKGRARVEDTAARPAFA